MRDREQGSTLPLILGFFLVAFVMVAGAVALGQAFVQQRDLQSLCDGAAAAAAAGGGSVDRGDDLGSGDSLTFDSVDAEVGRYLDRDPARRELRVRATLSADRTRVTLRCEQDRALPFGAWFGRGTVHHTAVSTARAAVLQ